MNAPAIRLAIVGCGAVTETLYLPALRRTAGLVLTALVDRDRERAQRAGDRWGTAVRVATRVEDVLADVDAAIVAVSSRYHAETAEACLRQGRAVLVEKPMALTTAECDHILAAAAASGAVLAVGLSRRFFQAFRLVKRILDSGILGSVHAFAFSEGGVYNWPVATDAPFRRDTGGGVLRDLGPHTLDLLVWWLGDFTSVTCIDDAAGGVEANCELRIALASGARGSVELSRTRKLRGGYRIEGAAGWLEASADWNVPRVALSLDGGQRLEGPMTDPASPPATYADVMVRQLEDFAAALRERREPFVPGREGRRAIALIEAAARHRASMALPWRAFDDRGL